ncbi:hypothetical protein B0J14DRAFT_682872 [Halenospora varia]|nr:hypothetical protein B0J14DRAFT_682872 [Halenospora varia]
MSPNPPNVHSNTKKPWPAYFLVRTTGEVVPLIAVDELPSSLDLVDVPRSLGLEETVGMLNLGIVRGCGRSYRVEMGRDNSPGEDNDDADVTPTLPSKVRPSAPTEKASKTHPPPPPTNSPTSSSSLSSSPAPAPTPTPSPSPAPRPGPKLASNSITPRPTNPPSQITQTQLCRHWCTHGICKWGQQCRYRHIMPMTLPGLREVGLSDWPGWWRGMNPGFFYSESSAQTSGRRARKAGVGNGRVGNGSGKVIRSEELGEQIIQRLRTLETEKSLKEGQLKEKRGVKGRGAVRAPESAGARVERVAERGRRDWEDDDSESDVEMAEDESTVIEEGSGVEKEDGKEVKKEKLVDV